MKFNGKNLVEVTSTSSGMALGLYLVPVGKLEEFETEFAQAEDQDEFDENNNVGAERIFAIASFVEESF
jgi:hypothetical protein